jgi:hypothetical protein
MRWHAIRYLLCAQGTGRAGALIACGTILVAVLPSRLALSRLGRSALAIAAGAAAIWVV